MTSLPAEVTYGTVVGKFVKAIADSGDVDTNPDSQAVAGSVTFAPISALKVASSTPPVTILPQPITVTLDDSGALSVNLVATDDPATNPHDWSYLVTFAFQGVKYPSFSFELPAGTTQDLTVLAPVSTTQAGTPIVRGVGITSSDVDEDGNLVLGMSDGTTLATADFVANVAAAMAGNYVAQPQAALPVASQPRKRADGTVDWVRPELIAPSRPAVTQLVLTFDDGGATDISVVKPILDARGLKGAFCIVSTLIGTAGYMTWAQVKQLHDEGHEIVAHSRTHINLNAADAATVASEVDGSFSDIFDNTGVLAAGFCWPFGGSDALARAAGRQNGRYGLGATVGGYNDTQPFNTYNLLRQQVTDTIVDGSTYTGWIDHATANQTTLLTLVHSGSDFNSTQQGFFAAMLDYAIANDVPIRLPSEALDVAGNVVDAGDMTGGTSFWAVGGNGSISSPTGSTIKIGALNPHAADAPSTYTNACMTIQAVQGAGAGGTGSEFPDAGAGVLFTTRAQGSSSFFAVQEYRSSADRAYIRIGDGTDAWQAWAEITPGTGQPFTLLAANTYDCTTAVTSFPTGMSIMEVGSTHTTGSPTFTGGTLTTTVMGTGSTNYAFAFQTFHSYGTDDYWVRGANTDGTTWQDWQAIRLGNPVTFSGTTKTLDRTGEVWVFTGSSACVATLPQVVQIPKVTYRIKNRGSASLTVQRASGDSLYDSAAVTSIVVGPGSSMTITNDGTFWIVTKSPYAKRGTAVMVAGTIAVSDTAITANSIINLVAKTIGGTPGALLVSAKTAGTGFTISSTNAADTSTVQYTIESY